MNIVNIPRQVQFSEIKQGECFLYNNCLFMKIEPHILYEGENDHKVRITAANMATGCITQFYETDKVTPVDAVVSLDWKGT